VTANVAILASGTGSNARVLMRAAANGEIPARVVCLVCDRFGAPVVEHARAAGVHVVCADANALGSRDAWEEFVVAALATHDVDLVVLAGYMRICGPVFLEAFEGRCINLHPSLLPQFRGWDAIGQALTAGVAETGVTVHYIDAGVDTGPAIAQVPVPILPGDTRATLTRRIQRVEHQLLPRVVGDLLSTHSHSTPTPEALTCVR
jgi:phosphoribosylglycinamide formyltransferase-1